MEPSPKPLNYGINDQVFRKHFKIWGIGLSVVWSLLLLMTITGNGPFAGKTLTVWSIYLGLSLPIVGVVVLFNFWRRKPFLLDSLLDKAVGYASILYLIIAFLILLIWPFLLPTTEGLEPIHIIQNALFLLIPLELLIFSFLGLFFYKRNANQVNGSKRKILFLSANPLETTQLRIGEEVRRISTGLKLAQLRDDFSFKQEWAVTIHTLQQALLDEKPHIVHFSGHGGVVGKENLESGNSRRIKWDNEELKGGLAFEDEKGGLKIVKTDALTNLFQLFSDHIECVVLSACYSEQQANAIIKHIPYVIGMKSSISDQAAIAFSVGFYRAIGAGKSMSYAFEMGKNAIQLEGVAGSDLPVLLEK